MVPRWPALLLEAGRGVRLLEVDLSKRNGLREVSQIAIDKITVVPAAKIGDVIGEASDALLLRVKVCGCWRSWNFCFAQEVSIVEGLAAVERNALPTLR